MNRTGTCQLCGAYVAGRLVFHVGTMAMCASCHVRARHARRGGAQQRGRLQRAMWDAWDSQAAAPPLPPVDVAALTARLTEASGL